MGGGMGAPVGGFWGHPPLPPEQQQPPLPPYGAPYPGGDNHSGSGSGYSNSNDVSGIKGCDEGQGQGYGQGQGQGQGATDIDPNELSIDDL